MKPDTHSQPVFCEADLKNGRRVIAQHGEGTFKFAFANEGGTRKIEMSDDEAWVVGKIISAMHPRVSGSNDPLWHQIQEQRKNLSDNSKIAINQD